ncbi:hypothetical protein AHiyo1_01840 [Arthrobacter sp. Hiyo1]|nr:hypothetical protein AHiyo1_01840 [Arthrobacter sp. Hiyo1]
MSPRTLDHPLKHSYPPCAASRVTSRDGHHFTRAGRDALLSVSFGDADTIPYDVSRLLNPAGSPGPDAASPWPTGLRVMPSGRKSTDLSALLAAGICTYFRTIWPGYNAGAVGCLSASVEGSSLSGLPKGLEPADLRRSLAGRDRAPRPGVMPLLARMGLPLRTCR